MQFATHLLARGIDLGYIQELLEQTVQKQQRFALIYPKMRLVKSKIRRITFLNRREWQDDDKRNI